MSKAQQTKAPPLVLVGSFCPDTDAYVKEPVRFIGVYQVSQHYGGPAEGGWWFDARSHLLSIPLIEDGSATEIEEIKAFLAPRFVSEGNIHTTRGGTLFEFVLEVYRGGGETMERPQYE